MEQTPLPHKLTLNERKNLTEVISFDDTAVVLNTSLGTLTVQGSGLQLKTLSLDGGQVAVDGNVASLFYEEPRSGDWKRRLFR